MLKFLILFLETEICWVFKKDVVKVISFSSSNLYPLKMCKTEIISTRAELHEGRVPLTDTVKMIETVEPLFRCRNAGIVYQ